MSDPVLIWTFRRSGGTALAQFVGSLSDTTIMHEPFNADRSFGWVVKNFRETKDGGTLSRNVGKALAARPNIKHCFDMLPRPLHRALVSEATTLGYKHVVLDRRDDTQRALSLELARQTGAWGPRQAKEIYPEIEAGRIVLKPLSTPDAIGHIRKGLNRRKWLARKFRENNLVPHILQFEQIYGDPAAGRARVIELLEFIGLNPEGIPGFEDSLNATLTGKSQNSSSVLDLVPNIGTVREEIAQWSRESPDSAFEWH
ncbi:hypothetical protein [Tropicimonas marinistellae]|uniref:hypothetical protein n=1 Tax=Tropicimonas marinistellae TaxID=1739787 RepID=UPI00122E48DC|nr:hypothetical protein [Tropicimonas marinistellae]